MDKIIETIKSAFPDVKIKVNSHQTEAIIEVKPTPTFKGEEIPSSIVVTSLGTIGVHHTPNGLIWRLGAGKIKSPILTRPNYANAVSFTYTMSGVFNLSDPRTLDKQIWIDIVKIASTVLEDMLKN